MWPRPECNNPSFEMPTDPTIDLPRKLRLVMRTFAAATHKDLYAQLKAVNPSTAYSPDRAYKWITGRSLPRDPSIYDDLAALADLQADGAPVGGETLRALDYDAFRALMSERHGTRVPAEDALGDTDSRISARSGQNLVPTYISGSFLMFSPSWSTQRRNCLVASEMNFHRQASRRTLLSYTERLPGGDLVMSGEVRRIGRNLHIVLSNDDSEHVLVFTISSPAPPAAVLGGVMSGSAVHDPESRPAASSFVCLNLSLLKGSSEDGDACEKHTPDGLRIDEGPTYLVATHEAIVDRLVSAGCEPAKAQHLAPDILDTVLSGNAGTVDITGTKIDSLLRHLLK